MNRRGNQNATISINRNQYDSNRGKSNDSVNRRNQYTIESKRVETKYNMSNIGNQKRNSESAPPKRILKKIKDLHPLILKKIII